MEVLSLVLFVSARSDTFEGNVVGVDPYSISIHLLDYSIDYTKQFVSL
jgi:hypothetical protein